VSTPAQADDVAPLAIHPWRSLRYRFVLFIAGLVALILAAYALVLAVVQRRHLRQDTEMHAHSFATLAVGPLCSAYLDYFDSGYGKFRELALQVARLNPDLQGFTIYDTRGRALFDSEALADPLFEPGAPLRRPPADRRLLAALRALHSSEWQQHDARGDPALVVVTPFIEEWGRHRYSVLFRISYAGLRSAVATAGWQLGLLTVCSLGLGVLIATLLARQSLGPVEALTRGAQDLWSGQLDRRIELDSGDEFEALARAFNQMAARLSATIADLERSNRALVRSNQELQQLDRLKSDLLANVSHELRTPLTAIKGYSEVIEEGLLGPVSPAQLEAFAVVHRNIQRLMGMIDQLLSFSRMAAGAGQLERTAFDLRPLVDQVVGNLRVGGHAGLDLQVEAAADLPPVEADAGRIQQVLHNLIGNAAKFTPSDGRIRVGLHRVEGGVEVEVSDTGIGIPADSLERIFERFYQVDGSSTRRFGGMGLGLAIVRELLDAHGVAIRVESQVGHGTTFRFVLPSADVGARPADASGRRILLIDDDPAFVQLLAAYLERAGFAVATATTADQGQRLARERRPDLIVLDRLLPDRDGFDLLTELKGDPAIASTPVLVVSIRREKALGLALGASGYLVKPIDPEQLRTVVQRLLRATAAPAAEILVVDDDPDVLRVLVQHLGAAGFRCRGVGGGREALEAIEREPPALMLLDLMMPDLDGWEVLRRVRENPKSADLPVLVLTARNRETDHALSEQLRVAKYLLKPFDLGQLTVELERALAGAPAGARS
jgi:signal transduction histidine kinase/DNA-binding response OmpR family regulator